ncbi:YitT family protein [Proteinivorax tanatarense]|uniref:YitT family protein n=1 Tax=Proteinivorax tanatarense TaxID=1260629 RepID=A0AAU7VN94_9FIRM
MRTVKEYAIIVLGCLITAISLNALLIPNQIAAGGVSGFATVLFYLVNVPVSLTLVLVNIPLFITGLIYLGKKFGLRTLVGTAVLALMVELTTNMTTWTQDPLLAALYGGVLSGLGLGLVFRQRGTTGGTDLAAQLLHKFTGLTVGQGLLGIDFLVIALAAIAFGPELAMYGLIALLATSKVIDLVQQGMRYSKVAFIISEYPEQVSQGIMYKLQRGVTTLSGKGAYTGKNKDIIFCVVNQMEVSRVKDLVYDIDEHAFVIVTDSQDVLGEGFGKMIKD